MRLLIVVGLLCFSGTSFACEVAGAQTPYQHRDVKLHPGGAGPQLIMSHHPDAVAAQVVAAAQDIVDHTGLRLNFAPSPAYVPSAMAYMGPNGARLLLYNPEFMTDVHDRLNPDWGLISILAHEIGHHLQGHIFQNDADFHRRELEADEFTGFVMHRMGASLAESQVAIEMLAQDFDVATHPRRSTRLAAIERGWRRAEAVGQHEQEMAKRRNNRSERQSVKP